MNIPEPQPKMQVMSGLFQNSYLEYVRMVYYNQMSRDAFLDLLYNKFGPFDVHVHITNENGEIATKWCDWLKARDHTWLKKEVNHRTICKAEIVLDLDLPKWFTDDERVVILKATLRRIKEKFGFSPVIIDTGKGYHLHYFSEHLSMPSVNKKMKEDFVSEVMRDIRSDIMKAVDRNMISIECGNHWKRGTKLIYLDMDPVVVEEHDEKDMSPEEAMSLDII